MKKKEYIQPKVRTERMQICNILAGTNEHVGIIDEDFDGGDAKMFGRFDDDFEDEDY